MGSPLLVNDVVGLVPRGVNGATVSIASTSSSRCMEWASSAIPLESVGIDVIKNLLVEPRNR